MNILGFDSAVDHWWIALVGDDWVRVAGTGCRELNKRAINRFIEKINERQIDCLQAFSTTGANFRATMDANLVFASIINAQRHN